MTATEYNECVSDLSDGIFRFALKHLRDQFEAENVVQNTFEKLWVRKDKVDMQTAKAFLFKIAYNNCIDLLRKSNRTGALEEVHENRHSHSEQYSDAMEIVRDAVEKLPEAQKTAVMLRDYEGYDYRSIGEITGMTEAQVKINIFRARQFLKNYLKDLYAVI
ncbi:MAG: RNA polymerase sigma factor [Flavobacteriales bacterium]|nr:RNA polymerase sigma factor [Bacteroidota bacterium]MCB9241722.1 RNA polymerase sigma factor [Flavobacteriales bacterium]